MIEAAFDEEVHVGSDVYRSWLSDPSDLVVPGGRPLAHDPGAADIKTLRTRFFDSMAGPCCAWGRGHRAGDSCAVLLLVNNLNWKKIIFERKTK